MSPRKKRAASEDLDSGSDFEPDASPEPSVDLSDDEDVPKKKRTPAKAPKKSKAAGDGEGEAGGSGKKKAAAKKPAKITAVTTLRDGWTLHPPSLMYKMDEAAQGGSKIACFDLDGTLIGVRSGSEFPKDADDWKFFNKQVPTKLRELAAEGYQIWVCSNQNGVKGALSGKMSDKVRGRFDNMMASLNSGGKHEPVHIQVIMATQQDMYRKPERNMWDFLVEHGNKGVQPDLSQCFYCGDMAGRATDPKQSTSDLDFAKAVGIDFFTPEDKFGEADLRKGADTSAGSSGLNLDMAKAFRELANLNEGFKRNAFNNVATIIDAFAEKITSAKQLQSVKGVGKSSLAKITEFLETGTLAALTEAGITAGGGGGPVDQAGEVGLKFLRRAVPAPPGSDRRFKVGAMAIRTRWFDDQLEAALGMHVSTQVPACLRAPEAPPAADRPAYIWRHPAGHEPRQLVMLGAGMDSRPWRMKLPADLHWYELDQQDVIHAKQDLLKRLGAEVPASETEEPPTPGTPVGSGLTRHLSLDSVQFPLRCGSWTGVACDLGDPSWADALLAAGFDPSQPTVWVAEGLLMYLEESQVTSLLRRMAELSSEGSALIAVSVTEGVIKRIRERQAAGERTSDLLATWQFGCPPDPTEFLEACGWRLQLATDRARQAAALGLNLELCSFPIAGGSHGGDLAKNGDGQGGDGRNSLFLTATPAASSN